MGLGRERPGLAWNGKSENKTKVFQSILNNFCQNRYQNGSKILKNVGPGEVRRLLASRLAPRCPKVLIGTRSGLPSEACGSTSWRQDGPRWAKMALSWPTSRQDVAKMAHMEPKMGILSALLGGSWGLLLDLGGDLAKTCENKKNDDSSSLLQGFRGSWGSSWRLCWLILALVWAMLGHLGAKFGHLGRSCPQVATFLARRLEKDTEDEVR